MTENKEDILNITSEAKYINTKIIPDSKFKTAGICLMLRRPLKREEATLNSVLASVLSSGSMKYPNLYEINKYMEELFGAVFSGQVVKKGEFQIIRLYMEFITVLDEDIMARAVEFLREILLNPLVNNNSFDEETLESEKEQLKGIIEERINDKNEYARLKCVEKMCADEAFGVYADGYIEDLDKIDGKALYEHYKNIIKTTKFEFIATGNIDDEKFGILIEANFKNADFVPIELKVNDINYKPKALQNYEEKLEVNQSKICMGLRANCGFKGKEFQTMLVLNEILGGSGNSKLFMNLREKDSLCYNIFSFVYRAKAMLMIQCGVENDNVDIAIEKTNEQIENMKAGNITDDEISMAKKGLISHFKGLTDYQGSVLDFYYTQHILGDNSNATDVMEGIEKVKINEIVAMAKTLYTDVIYVLKGVENGETA